MRARPRTLGRTIVFDGGCRFCTWAVEWALARAREPFAAVPYQSVSPDRFGLTLDQARETVWWIEDDVQLDGARAVSRVLRACRWPWPLLGWALLVPPVSSLADGSYALVSRVRHRMPGVRPAIDGDWDPFEGRSRHQPAPHAYA